MKVSIHDHSNGQKKIEINENKVFNWTMRNRLKWIELFGNSLKYLVRLYGLVIIALTTYSYYSVFFVNEFPVYFELALSFVLPPALIYGFALCTDMIIVNRVRFVKSVTHEIEEEMQEGFNEMENRALQQLASKMSTISSNDEEFEGLDIVTGRIDSETDEKTVHKVVKVRKDKKVKAN